MTLQVNRESYKVAPHGSDPPIKSVTDKASVTVVNVAQVETNVRHVTVRPIEQAIRVVTILSEAAFAKDWDNPLDAQYDDL